MKMKKGSGNMRFQICAAVLAIAVAGPALAGVSADEAKQLGGPNLTEFGATRTANADGSIPAYEGGLRPHAGADGLKINNESGGRTANPFAGEKPIATINAANLDKYQEFLSPGVQAVLKRFPDFQLKVYPSHRTFYYPDWVLKNSVKNATTAHLVGQIEGDGVDGAYGGIPFPIPKNGYELMWNSYLRFVPFTENRTQSWVVDANGNRMLVSDAWAAQSTNYYDPTKSKMDNTNVYSLLTRIMGPPEMHGMNGLAMDSINYSKQDYITWLYSPGQRRVRIAPNYSYDSPIPTFGGAFNFDEQRLFSGRMDRFNFKLIGKKEMYIPYNGYDFIYRTPTDKMFGKRTPNSDAIRWEKHRVWVVEATLKPGMRHVFNRRVFYIDEDGYANQMSEGYDHQNKLYRVGLAVGANLYAPAGGDQLAYVYFDFTKGNYAITGLFTDPNDYKKSYTGPFLNPLELTPASLAGRGVR